MDNDRWSGDAVEHRWPGSGVADKRRISSTGAPPPSHVYERHPMQARGLTYPGSDPRADAQLPPHPGGGYWAGGGSGRDSRYGSSAPPSVGYRHRDIGSPDRLGAGGGEGPPDERERHLWPSGSPRADNVERGLRGGQGVGGGPGGSRGDGAGTVVGGGGGVAGGKGAHEVDPRSERSSAGGLTREQELEIANEMERELRRQGQSAAAGDGGGLGSAGGAGVGAPGRDDVGVPGRVGGRVGSAGAGGGGGGPQPPATSSSSSASAAGGPMPLRASPRDGRDGAGLTRSLAEEMDGSRKAPGGGGDGGSAQAGARAPPPRTAPGGRHVTGPASDGRGSGSGLGPNGTPSGAGGPGYRSHDPSDGATASPQFWGQQQLQQDHMRQPPQQTHQQRRTTSPPPNTGPSSVHGGYSGQHAQYRHGPDRLGGGAGGSGSVFYPGPPRGSIGGGGGGVNGASGSGRVPHGVPAESADGAWRNQGVREGGVDGDAGPPYPGPHARSTGGVELRRGPPPQTGVSQPSPAPTPQYRDPSAYPSYVRPSAAGGASAGGPPSSVSSAGAAVEDGGSLGSSRRAVASSPLVSASSAAGAGAASVSSSSAPPSSSSSSSAVHSAAAAVGASLLEHQRGPAQRLPPSAAAMMSSAIAQLPHPPPRVLPREVDLSGGPAQPSPLRHGHGNGNGAAYAGRGAPTSSSGMSAGPTVVGGGGGGPTQGAFQSPLEMLGAGTRRCSYRVIQTAVPLGTRKVALQTLDDLALFFVDMRSTLLVGMAAATVVMDELCLRTETFEKAFGSPGGLVICAPQFLRPSGAMEEAGMLDGDLITHINGESVSADPPEQLVWNAKSVKGVRLLDITFLRATGESSATGYPWHEALAWWQSGVRRHMMESAQPDQRDWMLQTSEIRSRDAILSYRLYREYSMLSQRASMAMSSPSVGGGNGGGPPGNPPPGGLSMHHQTLGAPPRHPSGSETRGNSGGTTGGSSRGTGGGSQGPGAIAGGLGSGARGSPARTPPGVLPVTAAGRGGIDSVARGGVDYGVGIGRDRMAPPATSSQHQASVGGGGEWRTRATISHPGVSSSSSSSSPWGVAAAAAAGGSSAERYSAERAAAGVRRVRSAGPAWEEGDWGPESVERGGMRGRERESERMRGHERDRERGRELEREEWVAQHWSSSETRAGHKARSPLTVGRGGGIGSADDRGGLSGDGNNGVPPRVDGGYRSERGGGEHGGDTGVGRRGVSAYAPRAAGPIPPPVRRAEEGDRDEEAPHDDRHLRRRVGDHRDYHHDRDHSGESVRGQDSNVDVPSWDRNDGGGGRRESVRGVGKVSGGSESSPQTQGQALAPARTHARLPTPQQQTRRDSNGSNGENRREEDADDLAGGLGAGARSSKRGSCDRPEVNDLSCPSVSGGGYERSKRSKLEDNDLDRDRDHTHPAARTGGGMGDMSPGTLGRRNAVDGPRQQQQQQKMQQARWASSSRDQRHGAGSSGTNGVGNADRGDDRGGGLRSEWSPPSPSSRRGVPAGGEPRSVWAVRPAGHNNSGSSKEDEERHRQSHRPVTERPISPSPTGSGDDRYGGYGGATSVDVERGGGGGGASHDGWGSMRQSCDNCAKKKIKCSGEPDRCLRCRKDQVECVYSPKKKTGPTPRRPGVANCYSNPSGNDGRGSTPTLMELPHSRLRGDGYSGSREDGVGFSGGSPSEAGDGTGLNRGGVATTAFLEARRNCSSRSPDPANAWHNRRPLGSNASSYPADHQRHWAEVSLGGSSARSSRNSREEGYREDDEQRQQQLTRGISPESTHRIKHVAEEVSGRDGAAAAAAASGVDRGRRYQSRVGGIDDDGSGGGGGRRGANGPGSSSKHQGRPSGGERRAAIEEAHAASPSSRADPGVLASQQHQKEQVEVEETTVVEKRSVARESSDATGAAGDTRASADRRPPPASSSRRGSVSDGDNRGSNTASATTATTTEEDEGAEAEDSRSARRSARRGGSREDGDRPDENGGNGGNEGEDKDKIDAEEEKGRGRKPPRLEEDNVVSEKTSGWEKRPHGVAGASAGEPPGATAATAEPGRAAAVEGGDNRRVSPVEKLALAGFDVFTSKPVHHSPPFQHQQRRGRSRTPPMPAQPQPQPRPSPTSPPAVRADDDDPGAAEGDAVASKKSRSPSSGKRKLAAAAATSSAGRVGMASSSSNPEKDLAGLGDGGSSSADEIVGPRPSKRMSR